MEMDAGDAAELYGAVVAQLKTAEKEHWEATGEPPSPAAKKVV
jgi:hypothetical protein